MLPFNGIMFPRKIVNISEVVRALVRMDTRPTERLLDTRVAKLRFLGRKWDNITNRKIILK
jgi:hypothetical protein